MKNKKYHPQNRIKGFFLEKGKHDKSRIKETEEEKDQNLESPEELDDLS